MRCRHLHVAISQGILSYHGKEPCFLLYHFFVTAVLMTAASMTAATFIVPSLYYLSDHHLVEWRSTRRPTVGISYHRMVQLTTTDNIPHKCCEAIESSYGLLNFKVFEDGMTINVMFQVFKSSSPQSQKIMIPFHLTVSTFRQCLRLFFIPMLLCSYVHHLSVLYGCISTQCPSVYNPSSKILIE